MKRNISLWTVVIFSIFINGCDDALTILPKDGLVKNEYWKQKEDVEATLMGAYKKFADMDYMLFYYGELRGDMLERGALLPNEVMDIMNSNIYPWNNLTDWTRFYSIINYCNSVIAFSPDVMKADPTFTPFLFNQLNAEAIFLRSLAYFYLVRIYSEVPFIMYPYDSDEQDFFPEKTGSSVILSTIKQDLIGILDKIPREHPDIEQTRGRATRGAVNALLADISLWNFEYEDCIKYVEAVEGDPQYVLLPPGKWFTIFSEGNTLEGIFELQHDGTRGQPNNIYSLTSPESNLLIGSNYAREILVPQFSRESIRGFGSLNPLNYFIWKYVGSDPDPLLRRSSANQYDANWIVYRLADLLLMKAEALSQTGRYTEALLLINRIRDRASMPSASTAQNPQAFEDLILQERAKELAYEGKRWFDLLRLGRRNDYQRKTNLIELIIKNVPATQKRVLASKLTNPYGWYLPIYEREIESNPKLIQNPYYQAYDY